METVDSTIERPATASGTFALGGQLVVHRLGFGAMQLTGPGIWGEPSDREECVRVLRRAVELGVDLIDTADSYGPYVSEELIRAALRPYPDGLVIATKAGFVRTGPGVWKMVGRPEYLRQECEMSLRRLGLEQIPLYQLHRIDPAVPLEEQVGELADLQAEGKIRLIGLSEVTVEQIRAARAVAGIVSVQNRYNLVDRGSEDVLTYCERERIGFIPWFPLATGDLARREGPLSAMSERLGATPAQLALAWLLHRSPVMLPIPGTSTVPHLEENIEAALVGLTDDQVAQLSKLS
ncbi:MAG: aldo/keto reductase [Candidatus Dormibacteria bacterium]|jgi:aryl-alcohol dehydrogenase-like predicted oxidoreductase|nr:oxidoreductase [Chloroflexota bacterium]HBV94352.1 oxidoreductase [Chloroflexota bacterium]